MLEKRSLSLSGHRTSVALEPAFWEALGGLAAAENLTVASLVARIDESRAPSEKLASALRVYAFKSQQPKPA